MKKLLKMFQDWKVGRNLAKAFAVPNDENKVDYFQGENEIQVSGINEWREVVHPVGKLNSSVAHQPSLHFIKGKVMDIFELAKTITEKKNGDVFDFLDYVALIRKWMDKNYVLSEEVLKGMNVSDNLALTDDRFKSLRTAILTKPMHNQKEGV